MVPKLNVEKLVTAIHNSADFRIGGRLVSARGVLTAELNASLGELCVVLSEQGEPILAEVVGFSNGCSQVMPLQNSATVTAGASVIALGRPLKVPVGWQMTGRVIDALGKPLDGSAPVVFQDLVPLLAETPNPMTRQPITQPFVTGQKAIDGLLTLGVGQRVGLFAGSGVGKSTLLGQIAQQAMADINVVVLVGERGREVRPFIESSLGPEGLKRSIVVVSSADQPPLVRIRSVQTAITIADWFRRQGQHVLFMIDSLTRMAWAQRELGLLIGEPPSARGFTPSAMQLLARLVEQLGTDDRGAITGILTVLVDGDDTSEPVADTARGVLDGHIVLSRSLAERGHFPAIDISTSVSRIAGQVTDPAHQQATVRVREWLGEYREIADLVRVGVYQQGTSAEVDELVRRQPSLNQFLQQRPGEFFPFDKTLAQLMRVTGMPANVSINSQMKV